QFLLVVRCYDDDRPNLGADRLAGLVDEELVAIEFLQQVVWKLDIGLVDLIDQQHHLATGGERIPQLPALDVVVDVVETRIAKLAVAQPRHGIIFIKTLLRARGGLDVPLDDVEVERGSDLSCKLRFAGSWLTLDE